MGITHDASTITITGTETGTSVRAYIVTNSLGTVYTNTAIMGRSIAVSSGGEFTDNNCTWIFPAAWHFDFVAKADLFDIEDGVIVYTGSAKGHTTQIRAITTRLVNVQFRSEGGGRTDFFNDEAVNFEFENVQFISYPGGNNFLHIPTLGGTLTGVKVVVGGGNLLLQADAVNGTTLHCVDWVLNAGITTIKGNGSSRDLTAITRFENLTWARTTWSINQDSNRGQFFKIVNPNKPAGWIGYTGYKDTSQKGSELHTHNVKVVDEDDVELEDYIVQLYEDDGTTLIYDLLTDSSGDIAEQEIETYEHVSTDNWLQHSGFLLGGINYNNKIISGTKELQNGRIDETIVAIVDVSVTELTKATTDAYTTIDISAEFYDRAKSYLEDNYAKEVDTIVALSGIEIDAGTYNVTIDATAGAAFAFDGTTITIKSSEFTGDMVTTGTITLANGATFNGTRTDTNGTVAQTRTVTATVIAGTRVQVYNTTTSTEIVNEVEAGTSYSYIVDPADADIADVIRLRLTQTATVTGYLPLEMSAIMGSTGIDYLTAQEADTIYDTIGQDGSGITKFTADYVDSEVDLTVASDFTAHELYAWFAYNLTLEEGIRQFFGGFMAIDIANFEVVTAVVDAYLDNTTATNIKQTDNVRVYRDDGAYPVKNPTTGGGGIDIVWRDKVFIAETGISGLTPAESTLLTKLGTDHVIMNNNTKLSSLMIPASQDLT